jgi:hypothetical protein
MEQARVFASNTERILIKLKSEMILLQTTTFLNKIIFFAPMSSYAWTSMEGDLLGMWSL